MNELITAEFILRAKQENLINGILEFIKNENKIGNNVTQKRISHRFDLIEAQTMAIIRYLKERGVIEDKVLGKGKIYFTIDTLNSGTKREVIPSITREEAQRLNEAVDSLISTLPTCSDCLEDTDFIERTVPTVLDIKPRTIAEKMSLLELSTSERWNLKLSYQDKKELNIKLDSMIKEKFQNISDALEY